MSVELTDRQRVEFLRRFISDLAGAGSANAQHCENYTGPTAYNCFRNGRRPFSGEGATSACVPCMARQIYDSAEGGSPEPMFWGEGWIAEEFIRLYAESAQRLCPDLPAEIQPPAFPVDLDTIPWVQLPPQGAIVYIDGTGWVHFKPGAAS